MINKIRNLPKWLQWIIFILGFILMLIIQSLIIWFIPIVGNFNPLNQIYQLFCFIFGFINGFSYCQYIKCKFF